MTSPQRRSLRAPPGFLTVALVPPGHTPLTQVHTLLHALLFLACELVVHTLSPAIPLSRRKGQCLKRLLPCLKTTPDGSRWLPMAPDGCCSYKHTLLLAPNGSQRLPTRELTPQPLPKGLIISSPGNPTGAMLGANELAELTSTCRQHGIQVRGKTPWVFAWVHGFSMG